MEPGLQTRSLGGPDWFCDLGQVTASLRTSVCTSVKCRVYFSHPA